MRLDGTELRRITPWELDGAQPDYSPNGRRICFRTQEPSERHGDIALVRSNRTGLHIITSGPGKWAKCSFSPNGRKIASAWNLAVSNTDVYTINVDGTHLRAVTESDKSELSQSWGVRPN